MKTYEEEKEYSKKCFDIHQNGGILWLIERTDTNEYLHNYLEIRRTDKPAPKKYRWSKHMNFTIVSFLTKEDAENEIKYMNLHDGGCHCCGHGSKEIPIIISEHEFVNDVNINNNK